jgi:hypothetical protein
MSFFQKKMKNGFIMMVAQMSPLVPALVSASESELSAAGAKSFTNPSG